MKPRIGYKGWLCKLCGSIALKVCSWFECTSANCDCQDAEWIDEVQP